MVRLNVADECFSSRELNNSNLKVFLNLEKIARRELDKENTVFGSSNLYMDLRMILGFSSIQLLNLVAQ